MNVRRPFAPQQPAATKRPAFGALWALAFLVFTAGAALLWTGIAEAHLGRLQTALGANTKFAWLGAIFAGAVLVPAFLPKGSAKLRGFQIWALLLMTAALGSAVALRVDTLPDTAKAGTRTAIGLFAGAALDDPKAVLADFLTGENYQLDFVPAVPPGYSEALTRASAKATADMLLARHAAYVELVALVNANQPANGKLDALRQRLAEVTAKRATLDERAGLDEVLGLQSEVTAALLIAGSQSPEEAAKKGKDAMARAKQAASSATCAARGADGMQCALTGVVYDYEREAGKWRLVRPKGNDGLLTVPFIPNLGLQAPTIAPNPKGDDTARATFTVEQVVRAGVRISKKRAIDPGVEALIADEALPAQLGTFEWLMSAAASTTEYEGQRYASALKAEQGADGTWLELPASPELQAQVAAKRNQLSRCQARQQLKKAIARWNQLFPNTPSDASENVLVGALVQGFKMERASPLEFSTPRKEKVVLRNGVWQWWEPLAPELACPEPATPSPTLTAGP